MAISINKTTETGFTANGTYSRVENIKLTKESLSFNLRHYKEKDLPFFSEEIISCIYDIDGTNPIAQAYEYLKTLEEYSDDKDC
jgi:hypothetical protein